MAALGMPIVSTTHCDIPNVLGERNKALLVAERDTAGLVRALEWLIDNADQWPDIGRNNRAHIEQNFDLEKQARALSDIYAEITEVGFDSR
jgi:colanic acid/amylovoran biosynthesis glycosyltransferase